jgi:hypothetical protein
MLWYSFDTYSSPIDMFRQIAPHGIVNKGPMDSRRRNHPVEGYDSTQDHGTSAQDHGISTHYDGTVTRGDGTTTQQTGSVQDDHVLTEADLVSKLQAIPEHQNIGIREPAGPVLDHDWNQELSSAGNLTRSTSDQSLTLDRLHIQEVALRGGEIATETLTRQDVKSAEDKELDLLARGTTPEASTGEKLREVKREDKTNSAADVHLTAQQKGQDVEDVVKPGVGEAVAASGASEEARRAHEEMSRVTPAECPFLMNRE